MVECSENVCMIDEDTINSINSDPDTSWTAGNNSQFWGRTQDEGVAGRLGAVWPQYPVSMKLRLYNVTQCLKIIFDWQV